MDEFIKLLDLNYELVQYRIKNKTIIITFITNCCFEISCYSRRRDTGRSFYFEGKTASISDTTKAARD